ncbi:Error-prone, lesion bypass DNA polymerase V (UmuC) [Pseudomonas synxantha]|uniref:Error-prone, lesion bypass DNA polymerase V (UmuC) n=1 Tax=Pseudomonas synxantha TaxID=47883 RepID=A0A3G7U3V8_9PSED|nr:Error-prone, lesion bypass DNA polymerase V (UmuC) [Pseudomonas synxantha]
MRLPIKAAVDAVEHNRPGFKYSKAEVILINLYQPGEYTVVLFAVSQPAEASMVMTVLDQINGRWEGKAVLGRCA